ncbi:hypothetical protein SRHO_G00240820 [Serrasalmus rhombeus]
MIKVRTVETRAEDKRKKMTRRKGKWGSGGEIDDGESEGHWVTVFFKMIINESPILVTTAHLTPSSVKSHGGCMRSSF